MEGAKTANLKVTETDVNTVRTRRGGYLSEDTDVLFQEHKNHGVKHCLCNCCTKNFSDCRERLWRQKMSTEVPPPHTRKLAGQHWDGKKEKKRNKQLSLQSKTISRTIKQCNFIFLAHVKHKGEFSMFHRYGLKSNEMTFLFLKKRNLIDEHSEIDS